jgi:chromosome segregation ATPase
MTEHTRPDEPKRPRAPEPPDLLAEILALAEQEGALEGDRLEAFVKGLQERARRLIAERVERAETRRRDLEGENAWRTEAMATLEASVRSLEAENGWQRENAGNLEREASWRREAMVALEAELNWRREEMASLEDGLRALESEARALKDEWEKSSAAHETLLAHHREVLFRLGAQLLEVSSLSPLRIREARRRLRSLAEQVRAGTP